MLQKKDVSEAKIILNDKIFDIIFPMIAGVFLGMAVKGAGDIDGDEDFFVLVINDLAFSFAFF